MAIKTNSFPESTSRSQTRTLTIPNLKTVSRVTVNTGSVSYTVSGDTITFNFSGGAISRTVQTGGSPAGSQAYSGVYSSTATIEFSCIDLKWELGNGGGTVSPQTRNVTVGEYTGTLSYQGTVHDSLLDEFYRNKVYVKAFTSCNPNGSKTSVSGTVNSNYSGTISKPDTRTYAYYYQYTVTVEYTENTAPIITLSAPVDNRSLSESTSFTIQGTATDTDPGNVLTIKYKINNGPPQALQSGVSDGSTPLSFAKTLTYSNKRMRDGATDVTGADLAENVDHTLTVWAEDDQGGKSTEEIRKFRVIHNRAPSISDENRELGSISTIPSITYTVTDPEQNSFTITEKINGNTIRTFSGVPNRQETITIPASQWLRLEPGVSHTLTITATDHSGLSSTRVFTFTRVVNQIMFEGLETPMETDIAAERILLTPDWSIPLGAEVRVEACNNGFDAEPTWEDCTIPAKMGRGFAFLNTVKTAEKWGVNFRVRIAKGTSSPASEASFSGIGGAYDVQ